MLNRIAIIMLGAAAISYLAQLAADEYLHFVLAHVIAVLR